jgi:RND family efflux transporter MFP subunit
MASGSRFWRTAAFLGTAVLAGAASCASGCAHKDENAANVAPPVPVVLATTLRTQTVPITEQYQGTTGAIDSVEVRARVEGILERAPFKEGSLVRKGQLIFELQKDKYQATLLAAQGALLRAEAALHQAEDTVPVLQAQANLAQKQAILERANITVKRVAPLAADKALPQKDLDNAIQSQLAAKADVEAAEAQLVNAKVNQTASIESAKGQVLSSQADVDNAKLNLSYTTIYAPVTGLIGFLKYDVGNVVGGNGNEVLDTITTVDPIKVNFAVDENTYLSLAGTRHDSTVKALKDQPLKLLLANNDVYAHTGSLYSVNPTLDTKTGTIAVEARFPNPDGVIRPGQFARVGLVVQNRPNAVLVPQVAIVQTQGVNTAYVVDSQGIVDLRTVTLGPQLGDKFVVDAGLKPGDRVIVQGTQKVKPGIKVVVQAG